MSDCRTHFIASARGGGKGFTLVELLVVIALIALLAVLLIPSFHGVQEHTRNITCQKNLRELATLLNKGTNGDGVLPQANSWFSYAIDHNVGELLVCPDDNQEADLEEYDDMSDLYIVQNCTLYSNLQDVIDMGRSLEDRQILVNPPGIAGDHGWNPPDPSGSQALICIDDDAAIMVTYGDSTIIESIDPPGDGGLCGSEHWICLDDGRPNWRSELTAVLQSVRNTNKSAMQTADPRVIMRLTGRQYANIIEPPYTVGSQRASYGMSTAVDNKSPRPGQLMLVEYETSVVRLNGNFTDIDESLRPRHYGRANFVSADGSVSSMTAEELEQELHSSQNMGIWGP
jgi:prepilin-type N-terminal cleavage/methylation domain-containing protein